MRHRGAMMAVLLLGCAGPGARTGARGPVGDEGRRARPGLEALGREALEAAEGRAARCFQGGEGRVTVDGSFGPDDGRFTVQQTGSVEAARGLDQCVAAALETARIAPFRGAPLAMRWTVAGTAVSAAVRAMMAERRPAPQESAAVEADWRAVFSVLAAERGAFQACYEHGLTGDPTLRGRVTLRFTLDRTGRVADGRATGTHGLVGVGHCVLSRVFLMRFPPPRGGVADFEAPLVFRPR
jgi:hypothetical protein